MACAAVGVGYSHTAFASDAAVDAAQAQDASSDATAQPDSGAANDDAAASQDDAGGGGASGPTYMGVACDGALCATENDAELGGSCRVATGGPSRAANGFALMGATALVIAAGARRKQSRRHGR